ncbi:Hypothetical protein SRAE_1000178300 [Strongyloides ratti]|uniref:Uncharacterized protein n=1 Tax=Strongyloides ratti TaxID=34506 RepID=A0A090L5X2_STRRB|nr:Hypothetical protein SRAE_1000178300 [Strongyloides ratti]CEF63522.1 Hypothetical protein SRAE_1000178300 [Strongyloides ratti]
MFSSIKNAQKIRKCVEHGETLQDIFSKDKFIDVPLKKFNEMAIGFKIPVWESKEFIKDFNLVTFNIEGTEKTNIFHK